MTIKGACELTKDFSKVLTVNDAYVCAVTNSTSWFSIFDLEEELIELKEDYVRNYRGDELAADIRKG
jgi:hypothetical protein